MQPDQSQLPLDDKSLNSPFVCTQCKIGKMIPAIQEGEPEYTDNFICNNCQHSDTIPSISNIVSQIITSLFGGGICLYLMITYLAKLLTGFQYDSMPNALQNSALVGVSFLFVVGFSYVLFQSYKGWAHRRSYRAK